MNKHEIDLTDCKVLIVDDLPANLDVLSQALEDRGYNVLVATSGLIALKVAERTKPDLILLDVMMPEMDGLETCKRLKADPEKHDIPVIFLTAKTEMEDVIRGFEFGAVDYVTKPFNSTELLARVETHLKIHRLQKALEQRIDEIARMKREHEAFLRHELRNLITLILGYSQLVLGGTLSDNQKRWTSKILDSSQHMSTLMDSLQKLQEFEAGEELKKKAISLELHIREVISDFESTLGDRVKIEFENTMANSTVQADATLLKGVFQNLVKNAIEHVVDLIDPEERVVKLNLSNENQKAVVQVNNKGEPIPHDRLTSFFERFNTTKRETGGTGLGTTYSYLVTMAHGGEISVASDQAAGTTVTVKFPQADEIEN